MTSLTDKVNALLRKFFPPLFTIRINAGKVVVEKGKLTSSFLRDCREIVSKNHISSGWIWGYGSYGEVEMKFSSNINPKDRQRFRNAAGINNI